MANDTMARGKMTFRQRDLTRAVRGATAAGLSVARVEVDAHGKITVIVGKPKDQQPGDLANEWDEVA
jgi:hypothetical protein